MTHELSPSRSLCILAIVAGCFAILWPSIFYPMLQSSTYKNVDNVNGVGCCNILSERDSNAFVFVTKLCSAVLRANSSENNNEVDIDFKFMSDVRLSQTFDLNRKALAPLVEKCREVVFNACQVDVRVFVRQAMRLDDLPYRKAVEQLRMSNMSSCLMRNFNVKPDQLLGAPRKLFRFNRTTFLTRHHQERPPHAKPPSLLHPAFREPSAKPIPKPSSSPASHKLPRETHAPPANVVSGKKPPIAGMRPPMGGGGPLPVQKGNGSMSVVMPIYTVCIVIFFGYTMMRFMCRKQNNSAPNEYVADPKFYQHVFNSDSVRGRTTERVPTASNDRNTDATPKLGDVEIDRLRKRLAETEATMERIVKQMHLVSSSISHSINESVNENEEKTTEQSPSTQSSKNEVQTEVTPASKKLLKPSTNGGIPSEPSGMTNNEVRVIGTEINECYEDGQRWRCSTPTRLKCNRSPSPMEAAPTHDILLTATVPSNSQILISDARTEKVDGEEPCIVLESKVTLNVVSNNLQESEDDDSDRSDDGNVKPNVPAEPLTQHSDEKNVEILDDETDDEDVEEVEEETESEEEEEEEVEVEVETDDDDG